MAGAEESRIARARLLARRGRLEEAEALLRSMSGAPAATALLEVLLDQGRYDEARLLLDPGGGSLPAELVDAALAHGVAPIFAPADLVDLWAAPEGTEPYPSPTLVRELERELGYVLPAAYVELCRRHNGGRLERYLAPSQGPTSWSATHAGVESILAIGRTASTSLGGELGHRFMCEEWGYPEIGLCIADCPSAGHDMIMLDYRACGPTGEPSVVHVDQEADFLITRLAPDFAGFVRALVREDDLPD